MIVRSLLTLTAVVLTGCAWRGPSVIVIGVDGMDPNFVERHRSELPNLRRLRFSRLATTDPPQSPVAWSTFITGLDPAGHGIFDFVTRDPATHELFLSTGRTIPPRVRISIAGWTLPLTSARIETFRKGKAFWQTLSERGVPVTIVRIPVNYPPLSAGEEIAGMGTPDLRGTQSSFTFYTDASAENRREVPGGIIRKIAVPNHHADLLLEGPPTAFTTLGIDIDPAKPVARIAIGDELTILRQGEWSGWIPVDFPLVPHLVSVRGMVRLFAKQLHPGFELYVSPVNIDPLKPAMPLASPPSFARDMGRFYTVGIAEDTAALRQQVFDLPEFLSQSRLVLEDERRLLRQSLDRFHGGFLFFYFSTIDQNSHILWGRHDAELLPFYQAVDSSIGEVMRRQPGAALIVMSDHGFSTFERAVNLNTWLRQQDWPAEKAWALGLNGLFLPGVNHTEAQTRLLALVDPQTGRHPVERLVPVHAPNAPDFIVGYAPGYRASWRTGVGEAGEDLFEDNEDAWIADHCINAQDVPGVLFTNRELSLSEPSLKNLGAAIDRLFGVQ